MFQPIYHVSVSPTDGNRPTQGQRKTLTRVGFEPTTFEFDHRCSTDWATRSDGSKSWEMKMLMARQWICRYKVRLRCISNAWPCSTYIKNELNGSDRVWCKVLMFQPIYHVSVSPTDGNGPTQGQRKTLTRVGFEPTIFEFDHRCSTDWATRSDGSRSLSLPFILNISATRPCVANAT